MVREDQGALILTNRQRGSVTLVALCLLTALAIALGTYLALTTRSAQFSKRLVQREQAAQLAQIALEEALWALNQNNWSGSGPAGTSTWLGAATKTANLSYTFSDQTTGTAAITITNATSTGPTWPTITTNATVTLPSGQTFKKSLQATTGPAPLFGNAIASSDSYVSFASQGTVDSWNSNSGTVAYSFTAGNQENYNAVVAGKTNGSSYGVVLTQATVKGYVSTFGLPISYSTSGSPPAKVLGPSTAASVNVDPTRLGKSAFVPTTDVFSVTPPTVNVQTFSLISFLLNLLGGILNLPAGVDSCKITDNWIIDPVVLLFVVVGQNNVTIDKPTKIIVDGNFVIGGSGKLTIKSTGSLQLFVTGDVTIGGEGIDNQTHDPKKLAIFCTSSSTTETLTYTTGNDFYGVIYCENKPIDIQQNATFYGALLSRQFVKFSGSATNPTFHYDTSLRTTTFSGISTPYILKQVTEL
jgi:Tfp pilus assembly protein PilV